MTPWMAAVHAGTVTVAGFVPQGLQKLVQPIH
jgi:hypothetical protein